MHAHAIHSADLMFDRVRADRLLAEARDALLATGSDAKVAIPYVGGHVTAYRADSGRVRYEIEDAQGRFGGDHHHGGASRTVAQMIADRFAA